jgi:hypothetical protein
MYKLTNIRESEGQFHWNLKEVVDGITSITEYFTNINGEGVFTELSDGSHKQLTGLSQFSLCSNWSKSKIRNTIKKFHGIT